MIEESREVIQQRSEIARHDREFQEALEKLKDVTTRPLGVSEQIRENPLLWLGGGFVVGLWLGAVQGN
jgi:hypothetical protein